MLYHVSHLFQVSKIKFTNWNSHTIWRLMLLETLGHFNELYCVFNEASQMCGNYLDNNNIFAVCKEVRVRWLNSVILLWVRQAFSQLCTLFLTRLPRLHGVYISPNISSIVHIPLWTSSSSCLHVIPPSPIPPLPPIVKLAPASYFASCVRTIPISL